MTNIWRKGMAYLLAAALLCTMAPAALATEEPHWAQAAIDNAISKQYLSQDTNFDRVLLREEFAQLIQNVFHYPASAENHFSDVGPDAASAPAINALYQAGIVKGVSEKAFLPKGTLTRQEALTILTRAYGFTAEKPESYLTFSDSALIGSWARDAVSAFCERGLVSGMGDGTFSPLSNLTYAQAAQIIYNIEKQTGSLEDTATPLSPGVPANSGGSGGSGGSGTETKSLLSLANCGIVDVAGLPYAVLVFQDTGTNYRDFSYQLSGNDWGQPTPVNEAGTIVKLPLPDEKARTLALYQGGKAVEIIRLGAIGDSKAVTTQETEAMVRENRVPYLVLTNETISLEQYLKFIETNGSIYIKSGKTTVNTEVNRVLRLDAVSGATTAVPPDFANVTVEATIAVQFDMVANNLIAKALGIPGTKTDALLEKWDSLEKGMVLNEGLSLYGEKLGDAIDLDISGAALPKYVKYLTSGGLYGTKVYFATHQPDSKTAPEITIDPVLKGGQVVAKLSEENETWYRYLTDIAIPYSESQTYHYLVGSNLSQDGKTLTLAPQNFGATNYSGSYQATFASFGFAPSEVSFMVVDKAAKITATWNDAEQRLELKSDFSFYFTENFESITINERICTEADGIEPSGYNHLYIPYQYLRPGDNVMEIHCKNYQDQAITVTAPEGFVTPKEAPEIQIGDAFAGDKKFTFTFESVTAGSEREAWLDALTAACISLPYSGYSAYPVSGVSVDKNTNTVTVTISGSGTLSDYNTIDMTITVPGYEKVKAAFKPLKKLPSQTKSWTAAHSYQVTTTDYAYTISAVLLDGETLVEGRDYAKLSSSPYGVEIYAQNFEPEASYALVLKAAGYPDANITLETPADFVKPAPAPALTASEILVGSEARVQHDDESWAGAITKVTIQRSGYSAVTVVTGLTKDQGTVTIPKSYVGSNGNYTLCFYAAGYINATVSLSVVKEAALTVVQNAEELRMEFGAKSGGYTDYDLLDGATIRLNGKVLELGKDYTLNGLKSVLYMPYTQFQEAENTLVIAKTGYRTITQTIVKMVIPAEAPALELATPALHGEKTLTLHTEDSHWLALVQQEGISVTYGYSSKATVSSVEVDETLKTVKISLSAALSRTYDYTVSLAVEGYRNAKLTVKPNTAAGNLTYSWGQDGALTIKADSTSNYILTKSALSVFVDDVKVESGLYTAGYGSDYLDYVTLDSSLFQGDGPFQVEIRSNYSHNYLPWIQEIVKG